MISKSIVSKNPLTVKGYVVHSMDFLSALLFAVLLIVTLVVGLAVLAIAFTLVFAAVGIIHNKIKGVSPPEIKNKW